MHSDLHSMDDTPSYAFRVNLSARWERLTFIEHFFTSPHAEEITAGVIFLAGVLQVVGAMPKVLRAGAARPQTSGVFYVLRITV